MGTDFLRYRVGQRARRRLLEQGLDRQAVGGLVGPASGPKWLALVGLDRALLESRLLTPAPDLEPIQLMGASAGAWRMLAYASDDPIAALGRLQDGYIRQIFSRQDTAVTVSACYRDLMAEVVGGPPEKVLANPRFDLAILTSRIRGLRSKPGMTFSLLSAAAAHWVFPRATDWLFERVLFHSRPQRAIKPKSGQLIALTAANLFSAALASGSVPFYLQSQVDLAGGPRGTYIDGGLTDYHLNAASMTPLDGVVLLPHYGRRVVPRWLDKGRPRRDLSAVEATDVLQIYPSEAFIAQLPGERLPDREDFKLFVDAPQRRIERWKEVTRHSEILGEELRRDLETGRWQDRLQDW